MNSPEHPDPGHARHRDLLPAYIAGLLDTDESAVLTRHLAECESCRALAADLEPGDRGPGAVSEHPTVELLAHWGRTTSTLRGVERTLVREHVEGCPDCRQELELLGHKPVLEVVPALEPAWTRPADVETPARVQPAQIPNQGRTVTIITRRLAGRGWAPYWAVGGWATAAAVFVLLAGPLEISRIKVSQAPPLTPQPTPGPDKVDPPTVETPPRSRPASAPQLAVVAFVSLPTSTRGDEGGADPIQATFIDRQARRLVFVPPELPDLPPETRTLVSIVGPSGVTLARLPMTVGELASKDATIVFDAASSTLVEGNYRLSIRVMAQPGDRPTGEPVERAFALRFKRP